MACLGPYFGANVNRWSSCFLTTGNDKKHNSWEEKLEEETLKINYKQYNQSKVMT